MRRTAFVTLALLLTAVGCGGTADHIASVQPAPTAIPADANGVRVVAVDNGTYHVWTQQLGSSPTKVLVLHGGPGASHLYLANLGDHLPQAGIEMYFYDQLGSGHSDHPDDPSLWTIDRFREEVETVRQALGLDHFILYGHSWGGMLAIEYALKYQQHLSGLVISDMTASIPSYVKHINELRAQLPADMQATMKRYEDAGDYDNSEYQQILMTQLYAKHLCRLDPWPQPLEEDMEHMNMQVYNTMQGPSEFVVNGTFKNWDRWADLHRITVPTLLIVGRYDTMSVDDIQEMGRRIPHSRVLVCENGSHCSNWDDPETYFKGLIGFIHDVGAGKI